MKTFLNKEEKKEKEFILIFLNLNRRFKNLLKPLKERTN